VPNQGKVKIYFISSENWVKAPNRSYSSDYLFSVSLVPASLGRYLWRRKVTVSSPPVG
jgi:hypothetical protein